MTPETLSEVMWRLAKHTCWLFPISCDKAVQCLFFLNITAKYQNPLPHITLVVYITIMNVVHLMFSFASVSVSVCLSVCLYATPRSASMSKINVTGLKVKVTKAKNCICISCLPCGMPSTERHTCL